jgi:hypothetical protein
MEFVRLFLQVQTKRIGTQDHNKGIILNLLQTRDHNLEQVVDNKHSEVLQSKAYTKRVHPIN